MSEKHFKLRSQFFIFVLQTSEKRQNRNRLLEQKKLSVMLHHCLLFVFCNKSFVFQQISVGIQTNHG